MCKSIKTNTKSKRCGVMRSQLKFLQKKLDEAKLDELDSRIDEYISLKRRVED